MLISPHKHYPFPWIVPNTKLPQLVLFSCLEFDCPAEEVVKTPRETSTFWSYQYLSPIYLPSPCPFPPLLMGSSCRCPIDRIQEASDSIFDASRFWSAFLNLFWYNNSTVVWAVWKSLDLRGIEPMPRFFTRNLHFSSVFPSGNTGVPYLYLILEKVGEVGCK